jgi:hypothetical protein
MKGIATIVGAAGARGDMIADHVADLRHSARSVDIWPRLDLASLPAVVIGPD